MLAISNCDSPLALDPWFLSSLRDSGPAPPLIEAPPTRGSQVVIPILCITQLPITNWQSPSMLSPWFF